MTPDQVIFWFTGFMKYFVIGMLTALLGLVLSIILDAAIDLWEQWDD